MRKGPSSADVSIDRHGLEPVDGGRPTCTRFAGMGRDLARKKSARFSGAWFNSPPDMTPANIAFQTTGYSEKWSRFYVMRSTDGSTTGVIQMAGNGDDKKPLGVKFRYRLLTKPGLLPRSPRPFPRALSCSPSSALHARGHSALGAGRRANSADNIASALKPYTATKERPVVYSFLVKYPGESRSVRKLERQFRQPLLCFAEHVYEEYRIRRRHLAGRNRTCQMLKVADIRFGASHAARFAAADVECPQTGGRNGMKRRSKKSCRRSS